MLSRDLILAADDLPREKVPVPEWVQPGQDPAEAFVCVRTMRAGERDRFEARHAKERNTDFRARLAVMTVCDEAGNLIFTEADIPALSEKSSAALDRILEVAARLSKLTPADVDELEKNSGATPPASSASGSPAS